jgi:phosphopantothenoylcysteine synthetase/decarboxylase
MAARRVSFVACAAPLAARTVEITTALVAADWSVTPFVTTDAAGWIDLPALEQVAGVPVRTTHRTPGTGTRSTLPDAAVVCPATFNTVNKLAAGLADSLVVSALCEWLGARIPMIILPMLNDRLWGHPAWEASLTTLRGAGAVLLDVRTGQSPALAVTSGTGDAVVSGFDPQWIVDALAAATQPVHP